MYNNIDFCFKMLSKEGIEYRRKLESPLINFDGLFTLLQKKIKENKLITVIIVILVIIITVLQTKLKEELNIQSEKNTTVTKEINETENTTYFEKLK